MIISYILPHFEDLSPPQIYKSGNFLPKVIKFVPMSDLKIGKGNLAGKGVYANKDFKKGEVVIKYNLKPLTEEEYKKLPRSEKMFTHSQWGQIYLYSEPEHYVNHSKTPNTFQDHKLQTDVALRDIKKGELITTEATKDDIE